VKDKARTGITEKEHRIRKEGDKAGNCLKR